MCANGLIRICVPREEYGAILHQCHDREIGGHFGATRATPKFYNHVFISQPFLKMHIGMCLHVIDVKG